MSGMSASTETDDQSVHFFTNCIIHLLFEYVMGAHGHCKKMNDQKNAIEKHSYDDWDQWSEYEVKHNEKSNLSIRKPAYLSTDRQDIIELFYRYGNLLNLRSH